MSSKDHQRMRVVGQLAHHPRAFAQRGMSFLLWALF